MKGGTEYARKLRKHYETLRKRFGKAAPQEGNGSPGERDGVVVMIRALLEENASPEDARRAFEALLSQTVDLNDLRVSLPREILEMMGTSLPEAEDKAQRIHRALNAVFRRYASLSLDPLRKKTIRDARRSLEILEGMTPFAVACVVQEFLGGHAIPLDQVLLEALRGAGLIDPQAELSEVQGFLERNVRAEEAREFTAVIRAWAREAMGVTARSGAGRAARSTSRSASR